MSVRGDVHEDAHDTLLEGLDQAQRAALEAPLEAALRVIGGTGSGKSEVLIRRIVRALRVNGQTSVVILAHGDAARRRLREGVRALGEDEPHVESFDALAWRLASAHAALLGIDPAREPIARLEARGLFERCMEPLLAMEWDEIARGELEVELPGLGWPERFRDDAFDLLMRLIDAGISPQALREGAQRGAQAFYGRANLAELARRSDLTERQRASLILDEGTLEAQRRRELALAQVLTRLYRDFVAALDACAAPTDNALFLRLTELLLARPALAQEHRRRHPLCLVDDAHGCLARETALLRALYGEGLAGVTLAGQEPLSTPGGGAIDVRLERRYRAPLPPATTLYRGADAAAEARFVAAELARLIDERGLAAGQMAVIAREPRGLAAVERELIARDVPYQHLGSTTLFDDPNVLDVLALAGVARDPRDAIRLLRTLQTPVMALSDRTLYRLCAPPAGPQAALFEEIAEVERGIRRAERREMLVRNAIAGEADEELTPQARARLRALRLALPRWREAAATLPLDALLVRIADESGYLAWLDGLSTARRRHGRRQLQRLLVQAREYARTHAAPALAAFLSYASDLAARDVALAHDLPLEPDAVALLAAEEAYGHEFEAVFAVGAHAGSFPRYFSPPSFYFSAQYGVVARENLEDGGGPETAKFAWYSVRQRLAERYYSRERSLFDAVRARARSLLFVTAYGRATRARRNPELLEEMRVAREEGVRDVTQTWEP